MGTHSRNELMDIAANNYAGAYSRSVVFLKENSSELYFAKGYLTGICTAFKVNFVEIISPSTREITNIHSHYQEDNRKFLEVRFNID